MKVLLDINNKRNVPPPVEKRCEIHKYTLAELYNIVKDETSKFETCLIQFDEPMRLDEIKAIFR